MKKIFLEHEMAFFEELSYDRNPLHRDELYARRTQFGQVVVYGMYATLFSIGYWLNGRNACFSRIKVEFRKHLVLNQSYDLMIAEYNDKVEISYTQYGVTRLKIKIFNPVYLDSLFDYPLAPNFQPRIKANEVFSLDSTEPVVQKNITYSFNRKNLPIQNSEYRLNPSQLPFPILNSLLWSTYYIGMEVPGRQALFSSFDFAFTETVHSETEFLFPEILIQCDPRFGQIQFTGSGCGVKLFQIKAFSRPTPVNFPTQNIIEKMKPDQVLAGKNVLITGGSRGFGAALAKVAAVAGAQVFINFHRSLDEARAVAEDVASFGLKPILVQGDVSSEDSWKTMLDTILGHVEKIDILVNNASPTIPMIAFVQQSTDEFVRFVDQSVRMSLAPCKNVLPIMNLRSQIIQISSIYTLKPTAGFSHYIAAKSCIEGSMRALAAEFPKIRFSIFKPSKMITDQTNSLLIDEQLESPIDIAIQLLDYLCDDNKPLNSIFEVCESE